MRFVSQDGIALRLALVAILVIAAVSLTVALHNFADSQRPQPDPSFPNVAGGDAELIRCRDLGMAAAEDESCLAAWSEEHRRFMGTDRAREPHHQSQTDYVGSVPSALPPAGGTVEEAIDTQAEGMEAP